jgi:hypothetical protein
MYEYEQVRRVQYVGGATFIPVCPQCGRFVKADESISLDKWTGRLIGQPNASCQRCGRVEMPFEGFVEE